MYFKINRTSFFYIELNFFVVFMKNSEAVSKLTKSDVQVSFIYREMYFVRLFLSILLLKKISMVSLKFKIGKISLKIFENLLQVTSNDCRTLDEFNIHPLKCCSYPKFIDNPPEIAEKCSALCKSLPSIAFHCMRNCFISESGVIVRGLVNVTAAEKLFYACSETKEESLSAGWSKVLSDSIKNCESSFPIKRGIRDEDYVYFYNKFIECVRMLNFVNCDKPVGGNDKCSPMMEKMKKSCNASNYEFLHGFFYEVSFYRSPLEIKN